MFESWLRDSSVMCTWLSGYQLGVQIGMSCRGNRGNVTDAPEPLGALAFVQGCFVENQRGGDEKRLGPKLSEASGWSCLILRRTLK